MDFFNILVGIATIISCMVSIISLYKINDVQKNIRKTEQNVKDTTLYHGSSVTQIGGDSKRD